MESTKNGERLNYHNPSLDKWVRCGIKTALILTPDRPVNSASKPLIITEFPEYNLDPIGNLLGISHQIDPKAKLLLMSPKNNVEFFGNFTEIFLYSISHQLKTKIPKNNQYKLQTIYAKNHAILLEE